VLTSHALGCPLRSHRLRDRRDLSLRASGGLRRKRWIPVVALSYLICFGALDLALTEGVPLGIAYGIWAAAGDRDHRGRRPHHLQ
jgi:hypothetical protein